MLRSPRVSQARARSTAFIAADGGSVRASCAYTRSATRNDSLPWPSRHAAIAIASRSSTPSDVSSPARVNAVVGDLPVAAVMRASRRHQQLGVGVQAGVHVTDQRYIPSREFNRAFGQAHPIAVDPLPRRLRRIARRAQRDEQRREVLDGRMRIRHARGPLPKVDQGIHIACGEPLGRPRVELRRPARRGRLPATDRPGTEDRAW